MVTGNRGADMTAVVSAERATKTWLTGATGLVIVVTAFVMMAWAAPAHSLARPHPSATPHSVTVSQLESQVWAAAAGSPGSPAVRTLSEDRP